MYCPHCHGKGIQDVSSTRLHSSAGLQLAHNLFRVYRCKNCGRAWKASRLRPKALLLCAITAIVGAAVLIALHQLGWLPGGR